MLGGSSVVMRRDGGAPRPALISRKRDAGVLGFVVSLALLQPMRGE